MIKKLVLLLIVLGVLVFGYLNWWGGDQEQEAEEALGDVGGSGGSSSGTRPAVDEQTAEEEITPEEEATPEGIETSAETETLEEAETSQAAETSEEEETSEEVLTPAIEEENEEEQNENATEEDETMQSQVAEPETYLVRIKNYLFIPSELEINVGDTVVWRNFDESSVVTLRSEDGLFEEKQLGYGNTLNYTFIENGSYSFTANGNQNIPMTITVK